MTATETSNPVPGWYPDPWGLAPQRWWDGRQWTANTHDPGRGRRAASIVERTCGTIAIVALALLGFCVAANAVRMNPTEHCADSHELDCVKQSQPIKTQFLVGATVDLVIAAGLAFTVRRNPGVALIIVPIAFVLTVVGSFALAFEWSQAASPLPM